MWELPGPGSIHPTKNNNGSRRSANMMCDACFMDRDVATDLPSHTMITMLLTLAFLHQPNAPQQPYTFYDHFTILSIYSMFN